MNHQHHIMSQETSTDPNTDALFFGLSTSTLEILLIGLFIVVWVWKNSNFQKHPLFITGCMSLFFISMLPAVDALARHSVWLHCLQSSLIHHLIPAALMMLPSAKKTQSTQALWIPVTSLIVFSTMSLMWLLPNLHIALMESALLYSAMKWAMALSGIALCSSMIDLRRNTNPQISYVQFNALVSIPQALIGMMLIAVPPLYAMPEMMHHSLFNAKQDQMLGGVILLISAFVFVAMDLWEKQKNRSQTSILSKVVMHQ